MQKVAFSRVIALFIGSILSVAIASGQMKEEPSLTIGLVRLTLGESESAVRQKLTKYRLPELGSNGGPIWSMGIPAHLIGSVTFKDGKLWAAGVVWPLQGHKDLDFAEAVLRALTSLERSGGLCNVATTASFEAPSYDAKTMHIDCPDVGRGASITLTRARGQPPAVATEARVEEMIFQRR